MDTVNQSRILCRSKITTNRKIIHHNLQKNCCKKQCSKITEKWMQSAKEKLLSSHDKLKHKFNVNAYDPSNENAQIRSDELSPNPLTGLFLVLNKGIWNNFPKTMKCLWITCILVGSGVQWSTTWLLFLYLHSIKPDTSTDDKDTKSIKLFSAMMSCIILFIYVLGEIRKSFLTLYHYWSILEFSILHYWIFIMLINDISLQFCIAMLSVLAIRDQNNISDQLGISLAFFFILELDEWIYNAFIKDFDVLEDEDFIMKSVDLVKADDIQQFYHKKAVMGIVWGLGLLVLSCWVIAWFYLKS
eukprot:143577_1